MLQELRLQQVRAQGQRRRVCRQAIANIAGGTFQSCQRLCREGAQGCTQQSSHGSHARQLRVLWGCVCRGRVPTCRCLPPSSQSMVGSMRTMKKCCRGGGWAWGGPRTCCRLSRCRHNEDGESGRDSGSKCWRQRAEDRVESRVTWPRLRAAASPPCLVDLGVQAGGQAGAPQRLAALGGLLVGEHRVGGDDAGEARLKGDGAVLIQVPVEACCQGGRGRGQGAWG